MKKSELRQIIREEIKLINEYERDEVIKFAKDLKNKIIKLFNQKISIEVSKTKNPNPYIRIFPQRGDIIPNFFRVEVMKSLGCKPLNWDNVAYGNIQSNYLALQYSQWLEVVKKWRL